MRYVAFLPVRSHLLGLFARHASVTAVAVSDDGKLVALGDWSGLVRVFAIDAGARCVAVLSGTAEGGWWSTGSAGFTHVPNVFEAS